MKKILGAALVAASFTAGSFGAGVAAGAASGGQDAYKPVADTIVDITGDKVHGFTIKRYDGSELSPPTDSEARAECREYDTELDRTRCRVETRVWYRDLGQTKRALNFAKHGG